MKRVLAAVVVSLAPGIAMAESPIADACLFDALAQIPKVDGLMVESTSIITRPVTGERNTRIHIADIRVSVAARSLTYRFTCREVLDTVSVVRREILREVDATN